MSEAREAVLDSVAKLNGAEFTVTETSDLSPNIVAINYFGMAQDDGSPNTAALVGTWSKAGLPTNFRVSFKAMAREEGKVIYICTPTVSTPLLGEVDLKLEFDVLSHRVIGRCIWPFDLSKQVRLAG